MERGVSLIHPKRQGDEEDKLCTECIFRGEIALIRVEKGKV
jgi:hypothetical protein